MATRTTGAIALRPTGNTQGGYYFYSLGTGRRLNRNRWTAIPMPAKVIDRIHTLARRGNTSNRLSFADRDGINPHLPINNDDDKPYNPADDKHNEDDDNARLAGNIAGVNADEIDEAPDEIDEAPNNAGDQENKEAEEGNENQEAEEGNQENEDIEDEIEPDKSERHNETIELDEEWAGEADGNAETVADTINAKTVADTIDEQTTLNQAMADKYGERNKGSNLRPQRRRDYSHLHAMIDGIAMTQHLVKKGLKEFGDAGTQAVLKEM
jgi:hypothetical protein